MRNEKTNPVLANLIGELKKLSNENKAPIWRDIATRLEKPSSQWSEINLSHVERYADKNETVVIPGKLLGAGEITKPVSVVAYNFSASAASKVAKAGGKVTTIAAYARTNPKGKGVKILG